MRTVMVAWDRSASHFVAHGTHPGWAITINAPQAPDSDDRSPAATGFSPTELLLAGAGACAAWDVLEILRKRRQPAAALEVTVEGRQRPTPPWTYERVELHFRLQGADLRLSVIQRVVRLSVVRYCSVLATISGVAEVVATAELIEPDGTSGGRQPVTLTPVSLRTSLEPSSTPTEDER